MRPPLEAERLNAIGKDWPTLRLKYLSRLVGGGTPSKDRPEFWNGGKIPWVSPKDMKTAIVSETADHVTTDAVRESATSYIPKGTPIVVVRSGILKHSLPIAMAGNRVTINQDMKAFILRGDVIAEFFYYWVVGQSKALLLEWRQLGATVESIDTHQMMNSRIALPGTQEQRRIVEFLDRETARIDELISKKERQVALLLERQFALLDSLTGGRDEDSVEGFVPFKWVCRIAEGQVDPTREPWKGRPLIAPNHIESKTGRILELETAEEQGAISGKYAFESGTVLYSKIRPALAKACIAPEAGLCSADMYPLIPSASLEPEFLLMQLLSRRFTDWATLESMRVAMPKINRDSLGKFRLYVPDRATQLERAAQFASVRAPIEAARDAIRKSIEKLLEYRASLITAAVTGNLDVENYRSRGSSDRALDRIEEEMRS